MLINPSRCHFKRGLISNLCFQFFHFFQFKILVMEFTGRITADAKISTVKGDKEVVNFSLALNERYRPKGSTETKELVTYINVAWWLGTGVTKILRKGAIVTITGRLFPTAFTNMQGEAVGAINCNASEIKLIQPAKTELSSTPTPATITEPVADLPF